MKALTARGRDLSSDLRSTGNGQAPAVRRSLKRQLHKVERAFVWDDEGRGIVLVSPRRSTYEPEPYQPEPDGTARAFAWIDAVYGPSHAADADVDPFLADYLEDHWDEINAAEAEAEVEAEALPGSPGWGDVFDPADCQWGFSIHRQQSARWL